MKRLLNQLFLFSLLLIVSALFIFFLADGTSDDYYLRLTSPPQKSLILGNSKAAQGLQPTIFNKILERNDIYNFAFTIGHSPYGPVYFNSVKKKLKPGTKDGIFILTVDPFSLSSTGKNPNDINSFREKDRFLGDIENINIHPNIPYLLFHYPYFYFNILNKKIPRKNDDLLHENGWLEINLDMSEEDIQERIIIKLKEYKSNEEKYNFSEVRLEYLERTIEYLKRHGKVYLVRLPVSEPIFKIGDKIVPNFDAKMKIISEKYSVDYLSFRNRGESYLYTDGNHLYKTAGAQVSMEIAKWIKNLK